MRIRKRQVPLPLSSLSPVPLSDPHMNRSPGVQLQLHKNPSQNLPQEPHRTVHFAPQLSDQLNQPIGGESNGQDYSDVASSHEAKKESKDCSVLLEKDERFGGEGERSNDTRKGSNFGAEMGEMVLQVSSSSHQATGRWCEGEKAFPLKKRRGTFERKSNEATIMEKDKKMKTKMNKKCVQQNVSEEREEEDKETKEGVRDGSTSVKRRGRGGALMEGSRCSRVNGRGWRCCQQTLVGYSLCEHHLGKGRLRSMTSVRRRSMSSTCTPKHAELQPLSSPSLPLEAKEAKHALSDNGENEDGDTKKPLMVSKKKMKLGIVKARSISSLLGQANNPVAIAENNKYGNQ